MCPDVLSLCVKGRTYSVVYFVLFACLITLTSTAIMGDECDWTGRYEIKFHN